MDNALLLSKIYSHKKKPAVPLVDLCLIGRIMNLGNAYIITKDMSDFSHILFDRLSIITVEKDSDALDHFQVVKFSKEKFRQRLEELEKVGR